MSVPLRCSGWTTNFWCHVTTRMRMPLSFTRIQNNYCVVQSSVYKLTLTIIVPQNDCSPQQSFWGPALDNKNDWRQNIWLSKLQLWCLNFPQCSVRPLFPLADRISRLHVTASRALIRSYGFGQFFQFIWPVHYEWEDQLQTIFFNSYDQSLQLRGSILFKWKKL